MQVEELIEQLKQLDPQAEVHVADWNECWTDPAPCNKVRVTVTGDVVLTHVGEDGLG